MLFFFSSSVCIGKRSLDIDKYYNKINFDMLLSCHGCIHTGKKWGCTAPRKRGIGL